MKARARVLCAYENDAVSRSVASALQPDNLQPPKGMQIETTQQGSQVVTTLEADGRIETLLATLDDLLSCTSTAENML
jgi:hypothetical protein